MTMSLEIDLVGELYNPLYLFPIISVVFCAFLVYAFGFRGEVQPPTFQGNQIQNEKIKTKRKRIRDTNSKMTKPNGHIGNNVNTKPAKDDHQLKDEAKITSKSVAKEATIQTITSKSPSKQVKEASPTKQVKEIKAQQVKSTTTTTTTIQTVKDVNDNESLDHVKKKKKKSKSKGQKEGADDGWVTVKERKIRKPKDDKSAASYEKSSKAK